MVAPVDQRDQGARTTQPVDNLRSAEPRTDDNNVMRGSEAA